LFYHTIILYLLAFVFQNSELTRSQQPYVLVRYTNTGTSARPSLKFIPKESFMDGFSSHDRRRWDLSRKDYFSFPQDHCLQWFQIELRIISVCLLCARLDEQAEREEADAAFEAAACRGRIGLWMQHPMTSIFLKILTANLKIWQHGHNDDPRIQSDYAIIFNIIIQSPRILIRG
jgi:hypothetical protein